MTGAPWVYQSAWGSNAPASTVGAGAHVVVGNIFTFDKDGLIVGMRYYRDSADDGEHIGVVNLEADNSILGVCQFKYVASGQGGTWQHAYFKRTIRVTAGVLYNGVVDFCRQHYSYTDGVLTGSSITNGRVTQPADSSLHWNGIFGLDLGRLGWNHAPGVRYGVDVLYLPKGGT